MTPPNLGYGIIES